MIETSRLPDADDDEVSGGAIAAVDLDGFRRAQRVAYDAAIEVAAGLVPGVTEREAASRLRAALAGRGVNDTSTCRSPGSASAASWPGCAAPRTLLPRQDAADPGASRFSTWRRSWTLQADIVTRSAHRRPRTIDSIARWPRCARYATCCPALSRAATPCAASTCASTGCCASAASTTATRTIRRRARSPGRAAGRDAARSRDRRLRRDVAGPAAGGAGALALPTLPTARLCGAGAVDADRPLATGCGRSSRIWAAMASGRSSGDPVVEHRRAWWLDGEMRASER